MQMTLGEIAGFLDCELIGDKDITITGLNSIEAACEGDLTFASETKYIYRIENSSASAFIVSEALSKELKGKQIIISKNPYYSFARILSRFHAPERKEPGIDKNVIIVSGAVVSEMSSIYPNVYIDSGAVINDGAVIYPGCFIGKNVIIGSGTILYPNVSVMDDTSIGNNVIIHPGVVIGGDGFGYVLNEGSQFKIPQIGRVVIEDDVEIGANTTIDRAALGETVIGAGTKIDNMVMIAHNVKVGKNCVLVGQAGIAGSANIGDRVTVAAQAGITGHIKIGDDVVVAAKGGVTHDLKGSEMVAGFPAMNAGKWRKMVVIQRNLPELKKKISELEKKIEELEKK